MPRHEGKTRGRARLEPAQRAVVLAQWPTGHLASDLDANAAFLAGQPSFGSAQRRAHAAGLPLLQPRCGVAGAADQQALLLALRDAGARVLSYQVDSLTRSNDYPAAERAIHESRSAARPVLNGFPAVNHGVPVLRDIISALGVPVQTRHSTRDPRLLAEISYAGGVTSYEGGPVCYNIPYHRRLSLPESLAHWAYVDRLTGLYHERYGIRLDREFFGVLTATLLPPSIAIAIDVIEMLLAVRLGVKSVSLGYAEQGNRVQDIAAVRVLRTVAERMLCERGYGDVDVFTVFHQYMAAFPADPERAADLIQASAGTAMLSGATRVMVKTTAEATGVPRLQDNAEALALALAGVRDAAGSPADECRIGAEESVIGQEVGCILGSVLRREGDLAADVVRAFACGLLDVPFAPSVYNRGEVLTVRDVDGAVRFLSAGGLALSPGLRAFHEEKVTERRRAEGLTGNEAHLLIERDVLRVPRGDYVRWPLSARAARAARSA
jgi:methylaspartate mutase epsilon subunit